MIIVQKDPQWRMYEMGLVGRIAHNLAKYRVNSSDAYTPQEFVAAVREYMEGRKVEAELIEEWIVAAWSQSDSEVEFFITRGRFSDSHGGSSIAVCALIGPVLDVMGYEED
jgi:hypothetical protein